VPALLTAYGSVICEGRFGMSWRKDQKSKPKKGRFFPLRFGDTVRLVNDLELNQYDDCRIVVCMENIDGEFNFGYALLDLVPTEEVTILSVPESVDCALAEKASILALSKLSKLKVKQKDSIHNSYFCAYLSEKKTLILTRMDVTVKKTKYRGSDKLANAGVTSRNSTEIQLEEIHI